MLAYLRFTPETSRGRRYPEPEHPYRNAFQRDRDRVIHSTAFRRLEAKTQVFAAGLSDHFRNRLTHTIEVAQVSRTVARALGLDEDLTEALALVHDIGHPPFAHAGEQELDRQMKRFGDHFDHNQHALRIVESFEQRYARFPGLNLTFEVREGIVKHSRDLEPGEMPELEEYLPGLRPPIEAQLIDLADEVAYDTADLDDAFSAALIDSGLIAEQVPAFRHEWEMIETQFPGATERERFLEVLRLIIGRLVSGLIEGTQSAVRESGVRTPQDVRESPSRIAHFDTQSAGIARDLKLFLHRFVYDTRMLQESRRAAVARIATMFQAFLDHPEMLPPRYDDVVLSTSLHRVVCDYIAGMTDTFFDRIYSSEIVKWESSARRTP